MKLSLLVCLTVLVNGVWSQTTVKAAFLGNSYTYYNDLPNLIDSLANANGDDLIHGQNTPGGYTLNGHSTNTASLNLLKADTWDFVILQDQSQLPSFPYGQVIVDVYPKAKILCDSIRSANACAIPVFYNTWGRQNGDAQWDSINTFEKMNNRLYSAYNYMATENSGILGPVGLAFKRVYDDVSPVVSHASLYNPDGSHPSIFGSYLAACIFYNTLFSTNALGNNYLPNGMTQSEADYLQQIASNTMYMATSPIFDYTYPIASFTVATSGNQITIDNTSKHAFTYLWDFGDGNSSIDEEPTHSYAQANSYTIHLTASYCSRSSTYQQSVTIDPLSIAEFSEQTLMYPNPTKGLLNIKSAGTESIEIIDVDGKIVTQKAISKGIETLDLTELPSGIYFVKLTSNEGNLVKKLIKE